MTYTFDWYYVLNQVPDFRVLINLKKKAVSSSYSRSNSYSAVIEPLPYSTIHISAKRLNSLGRQKKLKINKRARFLGWSGFLVRELIFLNESQEQIAFVFRFRVSQSQVKAEKIK